MKNMTTFLIIDDLQYTWRTESRYSVDWSSPKAKYYIDDSEADKGVYTLFVYLLSVRGKEAAYGCYDYNSKEQAEQVIKDLNESYFN